MLLQPKQANFSSIMNSGNCNAQPGQHDYNSSIRLHSLPGAHKCYSPRMDQRSKVPTNINICPSRDFTESLNLNQQILDNHVFQPHTSLTSTSSNAEGKQEVYSGKLYIIRNTGSAPSSPALSPSRSPSKCKSSNVRSSWPSCDHRCSPTSSPTTKNTQKTAVTVRVYRCHLDHFAVINRDMLFPGKPVFLNLRQSRVMPGESLGRFVVAGKDDSGHVIEFESPELSSLGLWLDAFQVCTPPASPNRLAGGCSGNVMGLSLGTPPIPRSPALPTLAETDEK